MTEIELVKGLKYLGIAYGKEFDQDECQVYFDNLSEYSYDDFRTAVKKIIKTSKFLPKISDLIEECENSRQQTKIAILDFMSEQGYFKNPVEYEKAHKWYLANNVPSWLQEDINKYYAMMKQEKIGTTERIMIGG